MLPINNPSECELSLMLQLKTYRVKSTKEPCIGLTQENLIKFQVQNVYLIYTWLMVCTTLNLAYPKEYIYYMILTYKMT